MGLPHTVREAVSGMAGKMVRFQELVGRDVCSSDGKRLGRVYDIVADKHGEELCVSALLVGPSVWLERFGWTKRAHGRAIPWEGIASLEPRITLHSGAEQ